MFINIKRLGLVKKRKIALQRPPWSLNVHCRHDSATPRLLFLPPVFPGAPVCSRRAASAPCKSCGHHPNHALLSSLWLSRTIEGVAPDPFILPHLSPTPLAATYKATYKSRALLNHPQDSGTKSNKKTPSAVRKYSQYHSNKQSFSHSDSEFQFKVGGKYLP